MAEAFAKALKSDKHEFFSAGIKKHGMNPWAVKVMKEAGVDMQSQHSKTIDEINLSEMDLVVSVCDHAQESCPVIPGAKILHQGFEDPPKLAEGLTDSIEIFNVYAQVRDQIKSFIQQSF